MQRLAWIIVLTGWSLFAFSATRLEVGGVLVGSNDYYQGDDSLVSIFPLVMYTTDSFRLSFHKGVEWRAYHTESQYFDYVNLVVVNWRQKPKFVVKGAEEPKHGLESGVRGNHAWKSFFIEYEALADISRQHNGHQLDVGIGVRQSLQQTGVRYSFGAIARSASLNDYLFAITTDERQVGFAKYKPSDTITPYVKLSMLSIITGNWTMFGESSYEDVSSKKLQDSPLLISKHIVSYAVGLSYIFDGL